MTIISSLQINWLDIVLGLIFVIVVVRGFFAGFSRTVSGLIGAIAGFWVAANYYTAVSQQLAFVIKTEMWRGLAAFFLLFLVVYLAFGIAGILIRGLFQALHLSFVDRFLGAFFGFIKALAISAVITFILTLTLPTTSPLLKTSYLYPRVSAMARIMTDFVPENLKARFMWKWRQVEMQFDKTKSESI
ncbi:MAG: CvpA family protein [Thermodesulfobacteria bacterium]|nr:CvpA family protein [Thermodesulfobacteriota bacterium]